MKIEILNGVFEPTTYNIFIDNVFKAVLTEHDGKNIIQQFGKSLTPYQRIKLKQKLVSVLNNKKVTFKK